MNKTLFLNLALSFLNATPLSATDEANLKLKESLCTEADRLEQQAESESKAAHERADSSKLHQDGADAHHHELKDKAARFKVLLAEIERLQSPHDGLTVLKSDLKSGEFVKGIEDKADYLSPSRLWACRAERCVHGDCSEFKSEPKVPQAGCYWPHGGDRSPRQLEVTPGLKDRRLTVEGIGNEIKRNAEIVDRYTQELSHLRDEMSGLEKRYLEELRAALRDTESYKEHAERANKAREESQDKNREADRLMGRPNACLMEADAEDDDLDKLLAEAEMEKDAAERRTSQKLSAD